MTCYECVFVALVIHQARLMRLITSPVASLVVPYFSTPPQKQNGFRNKIFNIKFVFWFSL